MKSFPHPPCPCWHCGKILDEAAGVDHDDAPHPGAISICFQCGQPSIFGDDMWQREPTTEEWLEIGADKALQAMLVYTRNFIRERQHALRRA